MSAFKAQAHMRELVQRLKLSLAGATIDQAQDANGLPSIRVEKGTAKACLRIKMDGNAGRVDGLGLPQRVYSPHVAEMLQDSDLTDTDSKQLKLRMAAAVAKLGMKVVVWEIADASIPVNAQDYADVADLSAVCDLVDVLPSDEINPLIQSQ
jgi:hypothetical protein